MSLAKLVEPQFPAGLRERGEKYFYQGRVTIQHSGADFIEAVVRGSTRYDVDVLLEPASSALEVFCSCPYAEEHGLCKHIWATLLMADERNLMQPLAAVAMLALRHAASPEVEAPLPAWEPPAMSRSPPRPKPPPLWQQQLAGHQVYTPPANPNWAREHQVRFVLSPWRMSYYGGGGAPGTGQWYVDLEYCTRNKSGGWGKFKQLRFEKSELDQVGTEQDRRILAILVAPEELYAYRDTKSPVSVLLRSRAQVELLLPLLFETGRCYVRDDRGSERLLKTLDTGQPWTFSTTVRRHPKQEAFVLSGQLVRDGASLNLQSVLVMPFGWLLAQDTLARLDGGGAPGLFTALRGAKNNIIVPAADADALLQHLFSTGRRPALELPAEWQVREESPAPRFSLVVGRAENHWRPDQLPARCLADYAGVKIQMAEAADVHYEPATRRLLRRDSAAELRALARLKELGLKANRFSTEWTHELAEYRLSEAVCRLLAEGWEVEAQGRPYRRGGVFKLAVSTGVDWFELRGAMDFGGQKVELPALLAALQKNEPLVKLDDGSFGLLPDDWLKRYGRFADLGTAETDHLRFRRSQAGVLDALLAAQPEASCDELFATVRRELEAFSAIAPADAPAGFVGTLRPYQREGLGWLHFLRRFGFGGCLADDMGLGKTVQVLALLEERRAARAAGDTAPRTSLVVAPRSLIFNWLAEAARFTPELRVLAHTGSERESDPAPLKDFDLVLTTYGTLRNDIAALKDFDFDCVVLDEAQAIKNVAAATTKATRLLRARQRLALSGTPVQNHLGELWSLFEFLNPGMLGAASVFKLATSEPDEATRALRPFILRRTKAQVARDLPERTEETIVCELEAEQRRLYDELREHYRQSLLARVERDGLAKSKMHVLEALLRLRQAACHPGLIEKKYAAAPSAKLDALLPQLAEVREENHKTLVFSQFTSLLALVRQRLDAAGVTYEYLDGQTQDREACVRRFQDDPECKLFLISLKAGGLGLNLTAAEYVFLLDPWWNPAIEAQAIDRAHRIGQTRRVFAYRLIARDTVEEKIIELQKTKRALADSIIGAENSLLGGLQRQDLELLLS
jgi:superfamily II DNA or RNA helicase